MYFESAVFRMTKVILSFVDIQRAPGYLRVQKALKNLSLKRYWVRGYQDMRRSGKN